MPELPEVETTCRGIRPYLEGCNVDKVIIRQSSLRYPVPALARYVEDKRITSVIRRGKYLLIAVGDGHLLIHLGMSGSLRLVEPEVPVGKHDHLDWVLENGKILRYTDPRRFGVVDWLEGDPFVHRLLSRLGPEPLEKDFDTEYLFQQGKKRQVPIKSLIMDSHVVVGVGNIYANEALFLSGIRPSKSASKISRQRYDLLVSAIKSVLAEAVKQGGTTLRDFVGGDGKPGYFKQSLHVYGRGGLLCDRCQTSLKDISLAQRSTVYCPKCQR